MKNYSGFCCRSFYSTLQLLSVQIQKYDQSKVRKTGEASECEINLVQDSFECLSILKEKKKKITFNLKRL